MSVIYSIGAEFARPGIGSIAYREVRALQQRGLLQRLLCSSWAPTEVPGDKIRAQGPASHALRKLATFDASGRLWHVQSLLFDAWAARLLEPAGLLHVWGGFGLRSLRRARRLGMATVVQRASTHPRYQARLLREEYARWGLEFRQPEAVPRRGMAEMAEADYVLIPSAFVRQSFLAERFSAERLLELPFGVDTARFHPAETRGSHPFRALFVGQIGIRKGVPDLLEAWRLLGWRDAELWLVGRADAGSARALERWAGLPGVRHLAHTPEPAARFQQADVLAFPSIEEGSALVTYEALACGLPVVTTPNAGSVVQTAAKDSSCPSATQKRWPRAWRRCGATSGCAARWGGPPAGERSSSPGISTAPPWPMPMRGSWRMTPPTPKISVVIPTHNRRERLRACLAAVTGQDYPTYEVIVIDDGSNDGTERLQSEFPGVRFIRQESSQGPAAARNHGIALAGGEIVAFLDDDCVPPANWLSGLAAGLQTYPQAAAVGGIQEAAATVLSRSLLARYEHALTRRWYGVGEHPVEGRPAPGATCNLAVYRMCLQEAGAFDETFPSAAGEDADLLQRLAATGHTTVNLPIRVLHQGSYTWRAFWRQQVQRGIGSVIFQRKWGGRIGRGRELLRLLVMPAIILRDLRRLGSLELLAPLAVSRYAQAVGRWRALALKEKPCA